jgi:hypothetical protein
MCGFDCQNSQDNKSNDRGLVADPHRVTSCL